MSTLDMIRRFSDIPARGFEPDPPLEGWRLQRVSDDSRLYGADRDGVIRAEMCYREPKPPMPGLEIAGLLGASIMGGAPAAHNPPHPRCQCGIRVVGQGEYLAEYWGRKTFKFYAASGLSLRDMWGTDQVVLTKLRTIGPVTPGHLIPQDDPHTSIRTGAGEPLEIYCPAWVDPEPIKRRHPGATVKGIGDLPPSFAVYGGSGLDVLREAEPPQTTLQYQSQGRYIRVITGAAEILVPRTHVQPPEVIDALWGAVGATPGDNRDLMTVTKRLIVPLTDLTDPVEMYGAAMGLASALVALAESPAEQRALRKQHQAEGAQK